MNKKSFTPPPIYNLFILKFFDSLSIKSLDFIDKVLITK